MTEPTEREWLEGLRMEDREPVSADVALVREALQLLASDVPIEEVSLPRDALAALARLKARIAADDALIRELKVDEAAAEARVVELQLELAGAVDIRELGRLEARIAEELAHSVSMTTRWEAAEARLAEVERQKDEAQADALFVKREQDALREAVHILCGSVKSISRISSRASK